MKAKIDHIGYAVRNIYEAITVFEELGYIFGDVITVEKCNMMVVMGALGDIKIELISPLSNSRGGTSPVDNYLKKIGNTPYHICYEVDDITNAINSLKSQKFLLIAPPTFSKLLEERVAFMYSIETGLIELVEHND